MIDPALAYAYFGLPTTIGLLGWCAMKLHERSNPSSAAPGFSGAAVVDHKSRAVIGLSEEQSDSNAELAQQTPPVKTKPLKTVSWWTNPDIVSLPFVSAEGQSDLNSEAAQQALAVKIEPFWTDWPMIPFGPAVSRPAAIDNFQYITGTCWPIKQSWGPQSLIDLQQYPTAATMMMTDPQFAAQVEAMAADRQKAFFRTATNKGTIG